MGAGSKIDKTMNVLQHKKAFRRININIKSKGGFPNDAAG